MSIKDMDLSQDIFVRHLCSGCFQVIYSGYTGGIEVAKVKVLGGIFFYVVNNKVSSNYEATYLCFRKGIQFSMSFVLLTNILMAACYNTEELSKKLFFKYLYPPFIACCIVLKKWNIFIMSKQHIVCVSHTSK